MAIHGQGACLTKFIGRASLLYLAGTYHPNRDSWASPHRLRSSLLLVAFSFANLPGISILVSMGVSPTA